MKCQCCKRSATIHITEIHNGQRVETHLCEECAQQQGVAVKNQIPINELLSTLLSVQGIGEGESLNAADTSEDVVCPDCGMTFDKFRKEGLLGCPNDYEIFGKQLEPMIENAQGGHTEHHGKVPDTVPEVTKLQLEIQKLQKDLDTAVKNEDYEAAAALRDRIKELQEQP